MTDDTIIIVSDSQDPAFNLALEECLFNREEAYVLFYVNESSVIIGSNQIWGEMRWTGNFAISIKFRFIGAYQVEEQFITI